jgi:hypothetical protein
MSETGKRWYGCWLDPGREPWPTPPAYFPTAIIQRRIGELRQDNFVCLDLVCAVLSPLSEAGRYTFAHSAGLLYGEPWRLVYWHDATPSIYEVSYAESLAWDQIGVLYGAEVQAGARRDFPTVQLRMALFIDQFQAIRDRSGHDAGDEDNLR